MTYTKLTDVLALVQPEQQYTIYRRLLRAVREGELQAVPTADRVEIPGKTGGLRVLQHALKLPAEDALKLLTQERPKTPRNAIALSDLEEGKVSFEEAAKKYRESLQPKSTKRAKRKKEATP